MMQVFLMHVLLSENFIMKFCFVYALTTQLLAPHVLDPYIRYILCNSYCAYDI